MNFITNEAKRESKQLGAGDVIVLDGTPFLVARNKSTSLMLVSMINGIVVSIPVTATLDRINDVLRGSGLGHIEVVEIVKSQDIDMVFNNIYIQ